MDVPEDWKDIESAPKEFGRVVQVKRIYEGKIVYEGPAVWRTVTFPSFINGRHGIEQQSTATAWMYVDQDKMIPQPTHWKP